MTIPATIANHKLDTFIEELKKTNKVKSVFKRLKADYGQKVASVSVERSYATIVISKHLKDELIKIELAALIYKE